MMQEFDIQLICNYLTMQHIQLIIMLQLQHYSDNIHDKLIKLFDGKFDSGNNL